MKANELMIGDWVYCFDPDEPDDKQINKVSAIRLEFCEEAIKFEQFSDWFEEGWFAPIPITAEILEKNGFEIEKGLIYDSMTLIVSDKCVWWCKEYGLSITKYPDEDNVYVPYICNPSLVYVHELQHALRLCGLVELADNFKVE